MCKATGSTKNVFASRFPAHSSHGSCTRSASASAHASASVNFCFVAFASNSGNSSARPVGSNRSSGGRRGVQVLGLRDQRNVAFGCDLGGRIILPCRLGKTVVAHVFQSVICGRSRRLLLLGHNSGSVSTIVRRCSPVVR